MVRIYLPAYRHFSCLAASCKENCCGVFRILFFQWEQKLFGFKPEWRDIDGKGRSLDEFVHHSGGDCILDKTPDGLCVFLTDEGLCSLQKRYGIEALPSVCRTYPRLITRFPDRIQYALDTCCAQVLRLLEGWTPGELEIEGGEEPSQEEYLLCRKAMKLLSGETLDVSAAMENIAALYGIVRKCPDVELSKFQDSFLRRALAATIWAYVIPYSGHHIYPKPILPIMDFYCGYVNHFSAMRSADWGSLSSDFSAALSAFVKEYVFDDEIEGRYVDLIQERL